VQTFCVLFSLVVSFQDSAAIASLRNDEAVLKTIRSHLENLKAENRPNARVDIAMKISDEVRLHPDVRLGAGLVSDVTALLTHESDAVRYWIAMALGQMGAQAQASIPALEQALRERPGKTGVKTSATAIRIALKRIHEAVKA
jgi:hypothetical protein